MSIKGIENQIMVTRTSDYAREVSAQLKQGELSQHFLAAEAAQNQQKQIVKKAEATHKLTLSADREGGSGGGPAPGQSGEGGERKDEEQGRSGASADLRPGHSIDITI